VILQVLRSHANCRVWVEHVVFADFERPLQNDMRFNLCAGADLDAGSDNTIRSDFGGFRDCGGRIDDRSRVNRHREVLGTIGEHAEHFGLGYDNPVHRRNTGHLRHACFAFDHLHFDAELIAGAHGLAEFRAVHASQQD
jgi:hypothetical protein